MASGHVNRTQRPNTWLHRPMLQNVNKALANPEPSTHGPSRTCRRGRRTSALWGKADVPQTCRHVALLTLLGHSTNVRFRVAVRSQGDMQ